jgi:redox-sensitive bicupin YhaK (pirin superfamily)
LLLPALAAPGRRAVDAETTQETDMITIRKSQERGHADHGWLDTYHTFSFAGYHDPDWVHFGPLRVINQDRVEPGQGFGMHGHQDMEIVTYMLEGVLEHKDSMGNGSQMRPGEVQLMSAGTGVMHSEFNASREEGLHLLQMWVFPARRGAQPRYEQRAFPPEERQGRLRLVVSPDGSDGSLTIGQDVRLYAGLLASGATCEHRLPPGRDAWLHVATGRVELNGLELGPGDGAGIRAEQRLTLRGVEDADLVLWDLPADWSPR